MRRIILVITFLFSFIFAFGDMRWFYIDIDEFDIRLDKYLTPKAYERLLHLKNYNMVYTVDDLDFLADDLKKAGLKPAPNNFLSFHGKKKGFKQHYDFIGTFEYIFKGKEELFIKESETDNFFCDAKTLQKLNGKYFAITIKGENKKEVFYYEFEEGKLVSIVRDARETENIIGVNYFIAAPRTDYNGIYYITFSYNIETENFKREVEVKNYATEETKIEIVPAFGEVKKADIIAKQIFDGKEYDDYIDVEGITADITNFHLEFENFEDEKFIMESTFYRRDGKKEKGFYNFTELMEMSDYD